MIIRSSVDAAVAEMACKLKLHAKMDEMDRILKDDYPGSGDEPAQRRAAALLAGVLAVQRQVAVEQDYFGDLHKWFKDVELYNPQTTEPPPAAPDGLDVTIIDPRKPAPTMAAKVGVQVGFRRPRFWSSGEQDLLPEGSVVDNPHVPGGKVRKLLVFGANYIWEEVMP